MKNFPRLEIVIFDKYFAWHFKLWLLSVKDGPRNLAISIISFLGQSWIFFNFFYLQLSERDLSSMYQGSWIRLWTVTSLFCSMSRVAGWRLLRKITKHASLLYLCIFENFLRKLEKRLWRDLSRESCGIRDHNLLQGRFNTDNLLEI